MRKTPFAILALTLVSPAAAPGRDAAPPDGEAPAARTPPALSDRPAAGGGRAAGPMESDPAGSVALRFAGLDEEVLDVGEAAAKLAELLGLRPPPDTGGDEDGELYPPDPGAGFVPFPGFDGVIDDHKVLGAATSRHLALAADPSPWKKFVKRRAPASVDEAPPLAAGDAKPVERDRLGHATVVVTGGRGEDDLWTAGGVIVSAGGMMLTNFHVPGRRGVPLTAMTSDGEVHRCVKVLAADKAGDVALVQLEGEGFPFVSLAPAAPRAGDALVVVHHSEDRFYTFDRGHVRRHSLMDGATYMEISADYAVGGSGCGVFDAAGRLVGLVSTISYGSGAEFAAPEDKVETKRAGPRIGDYVILVRQASSWASVRALWGERVRERQR